MKIFEEYTKWDNRAELYVILFRDDIRKYISQTNCPLRLWGYCAEWRAIIHNIMPQNFFQLNGNNPLTAMFGIQSDISNICQYCWYEWFYLLQEINVQFTFQKLQFGQLLGTIKNEGKVITQAVLTITCKVFPRSTN